MWSVAIPAKCTLLTRQMSSAPKTPRQTKPKQKATKLSAKSSMDTAAVDPKMIQRSLLECLVVSTRQASAAQRLFAEAANAGEKQENSSLLDESTLESLSDLIDENMTEGMEILSDTVVAPLIPPLSEELANVVQSNSPTMQEYFAKLCEDALPGINVDLLAPQVAQSLGSSVSTEQLNSALDSIKQNGGSSVVAMAVAADFWKTSLDPVIENLSKDFAKHASQIVADHALEIFQKKMKSELVKMVYNKIDDIQAGGSTTEPGPSASGIQSNIPLRKGSPKQSKQIPLHPL